MVKKRRKKEEGKMNGRRKDGSRTKTKKGQEIWVRELEGEIATVNRAERLARSKTKRSV